MSEPRKICVVTGTRAEYGLLRCVMQAIRDDPDLLLQVVATGAHLSPEFGLTYREIVGDGFTIDHKVEILSQSDTPLGVARAIGLGVAGIAGALDQLRPDMIVVLGDRYEILAAAQAAMVLQIPLAHLSGGDNGGGTYDNTIRHCITKIAALHFVTHEEARRRVLQLGERADRVFSYGSTCVENIARTPLWSRGALEQDLGIALAPTIFLVTFHPLTMDGASAETQLRTLLDVLEREQRARPLSLIFTKANADNGGRALNAMLEAYVARHPRSHLFDSLGLVRYLSMMKHAAAVVGNSSSGIYEAPYLDTPTVDIGSRQRGRAAPASVLRCEAEERSIAAAIGAALAFSFDGLELIYGGGETSKLVLAKIKELINTPDLNIKQFIDIETGATR
ncbi:UDP-N-acetylglucosamine 2-epimerase [Massilia glaciei]|uniref:UDP-N-acetylglucosamine 2-epimerase (Hydrolyzing) n=1 Tax=Massilia glaciei TaxID=1524097 RepID=A0A2U2HNC1_9BURK|nr:UDP-N-acetylglucosamine 2-epimerase [Massilia glaciei]PWF48926.1 UDP-N-acetylglucosamine 2-epimerase (hydrolyzing) [Massilia glaciei]